MKIKILILSLLSWGISYGQNYFELVQVGSEYSKEEINEAFSTATFCGYHFNSKRNLLVFDDGTQVELLSKEELLNPTIENLGLSDKCFREDHLVFQESVWYIKNEKIVRGIKPSNVSKQ